MVVKLRKCKYVLLTFILFQQTMIITILFLRLFIWFTRKFYIEIQKGEKLLVSTALNKTKKETSSSTLQKMISKSYSDLNISRATCKKHSILRIHYTPSTSAESSVSPSNKTSLTEGQHDIQRYSWWDLEKMKTRLYGTNTDACMNLLQF